MSNGSTFMVSSPLLIRLVKFPEKLICDREDPRKVEFIQLKLLRYLIIALGRPYRYLHIFSSALTLLTFHVSKCLPIPTRKVMKKKKRSKKLPITRLAFLKFLPTCIHLLVYTANQLFLKLNQFVEGN